MTIGCRFQGAANNSNVSVFLPAIYASIYFHTRVIHRQNVQEFFCSSTPILFVPGIQTPRSQLATWASNSRSSRHSLQTSEAISDEKTYPLHLQKLLEASRATRSNLNLKEQFIPNVCRQSHHWNNPKSTRQNQSTDLSVA